MSRKISALALFLSAALPALALEKVINLSDCTGVQGNSMGLAGNVSEPVAVFDEHHHYITWFARGNLIVMAEYDADLDCPTRLVEIADGSDSMSRSHDSPAVFVDGQGYLYTTYLGRMITDLGLPNRNEAPMLQRSLVPLDITSWVQMDGDEGIDRARVNNHSEMTGMRLVDGSVLLAGTDTEVIIDRIRPGGFYEWPYARKVLSADRTEHPDIPNRRSFSKTVVHEGQRAAPRRLYSVWGWSCQPHAACEHYTDNSNEVFFGYSNDAGITWHNRDFTVAVEAEPAIPPEYGGERVGIKIIDPEFKVSDTLQAEHRAIWEDEERTVYIAFNTARCNTELCPEPRGALKMLRVRLTEDGCDNTIDTCVEEFEVAATEHSYLPVIRKHEDTIYIYAFSVDQGALVEYSSADEGRTWDNRVIVDDCGRCGRAHGLEKVPGPYDSVHIALACPRPPSGCYGTGRDMMYYFRSFEPLPDSRD